MPYSQIASTACPQMPELAQQTRLEIAEQQKRLDQMEDLENAGTAISDNIATSTEFPESFEDDDEQYDLARQP